MKLTEMTTEQLCNALCAIADPIERITQDKGLNELLSEYEKSFDEHMPVFEKAGRLLGNIIPALLGRHYEDTVKVIAAMTGKSTAEIKGQNCMQTIADIRTFFDKDFVGFFTTSVGTEQSA